MKRVHALYRVSTKGQVDVTKDDIPMQRISCHDFCEKNGWTLTREFEEKGISGFKVSAEKRDAIQELKEAALKKEFDILLVFMFDRLGRIESETPFVLEWFTSNGIEVWSVNEGEQKMEHHVDKLMNYIRFWQASGESEKTSIRVKTRMHQMTTEGVFTGGVVRFGYQLVDKGRLNKKGQPMRDLAPKQPEFDVLGTIFRMIKFEGYGTYKVANWLNKNGYKTSTGKEFTSTSVRRVMKDEICRGYLVRGGVRSERITELQAVSDELFFGVQDIFQQRDHKNDEKRQIAMTNKGKALLSGNIYCAHCGCRLATTRYKEEYTRADGSKYHNEYVRYICYHRSRGLNDCDGATTYIAEKIDNFVIEVMRKIFSSITGCPQEEKIETAYKKMVSENQHLQARLTLQLQKDIKQLESLRSEIAKALAGDSVFTPEDLSQSMKELKARIDEAEAKLEYLKNEEAQKKAMSDSIIPAYKQFKTWSEEFESATLETRKMIASQLFTRVEVGKEYKIRLVLDATYKQFCEEWLTPNLLTAVA